MTADQTLAPKQQRSRETLARLLSATIEVLNEHGLDGATIPRIAAAAGVAPASVYRRFRDRDALYRAAFLDVLEKSGAGNRERAALAASKHPTLEAFAGIVVRSVVRQYRSHPKLLHAFNRFVQSDTDKAFVAKGLAIAADNFRVFVDLLLRHFGSEITHPNPQLAITLGLAGVVTTAEERALQEVSVLHELLPISDEQLEQELTRAFLAYLRS